MSRKLLFPFLAAFDRAGQRRDALDVTELARHLAGQPVGAFLPE
jgi:protein involved in ribonucleotide reduction